MARVTVNEAAAIGGVCNYSAWGAAADKAATGVTLSNYQHRVYVLPANVGCSWAGLAYVGCGNSCQAWVKAYSGQACGYNDAYAHEIGHNLGMWHASTDTNNDGTLDCEYCDTSDFMGYATSSLRTQNGPHKVQMGWASGARVVDGSQGGTFTVSSLALTAAGSPQVIRVRPNSGDPYYLSLRTGVGYDAGMPSSATYLNKVNIHRWSGSGNTRYIGAIGDGQSYNDAASGVSIQLVSRTADSATFSVTTTCATQAPTATISPASQGAGATLPATRAYTVTVTNRDSAACGSSTFALSSAVPSGWSGGFAAPTIALAPGASGTATLSVTAPAGAGSGSYTVSAGTAGDGSHAAATGQRDVLDRHGGAERARQPARIAQGYEGDAVVDRHHRQRQLGRRSLRGPARNERRGHFGLDHLQRVAGQRHVDLHRGGHRRRGQRSRRARRLGEGRAQVS